MPQIIVSDVSSIRLNIHVFVSITKTLVMRVGESLPDDIARSLEASVYTGVSGYIIMSRHPSLSSSSSSSLPCTGSTSLTGPATTSWSTTPSTPRWVLLLSSPDRDTCDTCGVLQVCKMVFDMTGATRQYVDMEIDYDGVSCHKLCYLALCGV